MLRTWDIAWLLILRKPIFGRQPWGMLGKNFLWLPISHRGLLQLELQRSFPQLGHLDHILPSHLLSRPLVPRLPPDPHMMDEIQCLLGTHQASSHQQQTLHLVDAHCQVGIVIASSKIIKSSFINFNWNSWFLYGLLYPLLQISNSLSNSSPLLLQSKVCPCLWIQQLVVVGNSLWTLL